MAIQPAVLSNEDIRSDAGVGVIGDTLVLAYPGDVTVTITLQPGDGKRVEGDNNIGEHLRTDLSELFACAVDGANLMIGAANQNDVCNVNSVFEEALEKVTDIPQLESRPQVTFVTKSIANTRNCKCRCKARSWD